MRGIPERADECCRKRCECEKEIKAERAVAAGESDRDGRACAQGRDSRDDKKRDRRVESEAPAECATKEKKEDHNKHELVQNVLY